MTGKQKCTLLKQIRKEIAESNGIVYLTSECDYEGDCLGTCPKCDAEIRWLDAEIQRKAESGEAIKISRITLDGMKLDEMFPSKMIDVKKEGKKEEFFDIQGKVLDDFLCMPEENIGEEDEPEKISCGTVQIAWDE